MTREEALLKLIAVEPVTQGQLVHETGWGIEATKETLARLREQHRVTYWSGNNRRWLCVAPTAPKGAAC